MVGVNISRRSEDFTIVIDTREQKPYGGIRGRFDHPSKKGTLKTGDYSIEGYEDRFAVERKSLDDWVGSTTQGRERFEREMVRLSEMDFAAVIIETDLSKIWTARIHSRVPKKSIVNTALKWTVKYGIPIQFVSGRTGGKYAVEAYAEAFWKYYVKGENK